MSANVQPRNRIRHLTWNAVELSGAVPFAIIHVLALCTFWVGVTPASIVCCIALYLVRMFGVTAGYHRYFAHRTYKTSRVFQFILAFIAQSSAQKGALWWAAHHRAHHLNSDQPEDLHSPVQDGFWYSHMLWLFDRTSATDFARIPDLARYPELRFLNKFYLAPPIMLGAAVFWFLGWPGLFMGFFVSTVITWHATFTINSLSHVFGKRRYATTDDSRNNWFLAIITLGEGWHNNHHRFSSSVRQGFYWYEYDISFYVLKVLSWFGIVWKLRTIPASVLEEGRRNELRHGAMGAPIAAVRTAESPAQ